jgi:hypothetical protein
MRNAVALLLAAVALAGCGRSGGNAQNVAGGSGLLMPGPRPDATASLASDSNFRQRFREINIASCIASSQARSARGDGAPPGTDFRGYCTCTVDRAIEGVPTEQLASLRPGPREQAIATQCAQRIGMGADLTDNGGK